MNCLQGEPFWCLRGRTALSGGFAEQVLTNERDAVVLPESLSYADGAMIEPLSVALHGVHLAQLAPGMRVLVQGAGPIGLAATFWARRLGAGRVAVMDTSRKREPVARQLGASEFVVAGEDPAAAAAEALGGAPDVVIEAAGAPGALRQALEVVGLRSTVVVLGFCTLDETFVPARAIMKQVRLQFSFAFGMADFRYAVDTLASGAVEPRAMVTETVPLAGLPALFEDLRAPNEHCKVMVAPQA